MEINLSLKKRIKEINLIMHGTNKKVLQEKISELLLLFNRVDMEYLDKDLIDETRKLKERILIEEAKFKLKKAFDKDRKLVKIDDFNELCNLMKYHQFDEALRKFNERNN